MQQLKLTEKEKQALDLIVKAMQDPEVVAALKDEGKNNGSSKV